MAVRHEIIFIHSRADFLLKQVQHLAGDNCIMSCSPNIIRASSQEGWDGRGCSARGKM